MTNIAVEYHAMRDAAGQLKTHEHNITDILNLAQTLVKNLTAAGFNTDHASKAFDDSYTQFTQGATNMIHGMEGMAGYLTNAADQMEQMDHGLAHAIGGS